MEFPIRVFSTVERTESYIFQMFDNFPTLCNAKKRARILAHGLERTWIERSTNNWFGGFEWDVARVREELVRLRHRLLEAEVEGIGSLGDKDEAGFTVIYVS